MPWLRERSRGLGAFALFAMALQIFCTFGHFHLAEGLGFRASGVKVSIASIHVAAEKASVAAASETLPSNSDGDALCPLCLVGNLVSSAVAVAAPALVLPVAYRLLGPPQHESNVTGISVQTPFWSRGPPQS